MKKFFTFMSACLLALVASAQSTKLTFEDSDYVTAYPNYLGQTRAKNNIQMRKASEEGLKCLIITLESGEGEELKAIASGDVPENFQSSVVSDGTMPEQLDKNEYRKITISGFPQGTIISRLSASVGVDAVGRGAGKMVATADGTEIGELLWRGKRVTYEQYGTLVNGTEELDFELYDGVSTTCNDNLVFDCYNVEITEKKSLSGVIDISKWHVYYTDNVITSIKDAVDGNTQSDVIYNLHGSRVASPVKGHIYVKNGRKVVF